MDGLALLGIIISGSIIGTIYIMAWVVAIEILTFGTVKWQEVLAKIFIGLHILAILAWFVWSWMYLF